MAAIRGCARRNADAIHRLAQPALHDAARQLARRDIDPACADNDAALAELEVLPTLLWLNARRETLATAGMTAARSCPVRSPQCGGGREPSRFAFAHDHLVADALAGADHGRMPKRIVRRAAVRQPRAPRSSQGERAAASPIMRSRAATPATTRRRSRGRRDAEAPPTGLLGFCNDEWADARLRRVPSLSTLARGFRWGNAGRPRS